MTSRPLALHTFRLYSCSSSYSLVSLPVYMFVCTCSHTSLATALEIAARGWAVLLRPSSACSLFSFPGRGLKRTRFDFVPGVCCGSPSRACSGPFRPALLGLYSDLLLCLLLLCCVFAPLATLTPFSLTSYPLGSHVTAAYMIIHVYVRRISLSLALFLSPSLSRSTML